MALAIARLGLGVLAALALGLIAAPGPLRAADSGVRWEEKIEVAAGGAHRGPWRMNDSEFHYVDDPTVAMNDEGVVGIAWADQTRQDIFFQSYGADGKPRLEVPANVSGSPRIFSWLPRLVISAGDARLVFVLWQEIVFSGGSHGGEILFARSTDGGKTFEKPVNLSNSIAGDGKGRTTRKRWHNGSLDLAVGPQGDLYAAWTEYEGNLWFSRSTDGGGTFTEPLRVAGVPEAKPARGPSLAVDAAGTIYLAWAVGEDKSADIHLATSTDRGQSFSAPRAIVPSGGHADAPKLAVDGKGTLHLVHAESPTGPFDRYHVRYAHSTDGADTFEDPREISSPQAERFESVSFPAMSLVGDDDVYIIWELFPRRRGYSRGLGFTSSRDGGKTFAPPLFVPGSMDPELGVNGSQQGLLMRKLATNASGALALVNSTFKKNRASRIWLIRGQAAGR